VDAKPKEVLLFQDISHIRKMGREGGGRCEEWRGKWVSVIDDYTRQAVASIAPLRSSRIAVQFLERVLSELCVAP
jgi:hypothetical protein